MGRGLSDTTIARDLYASVPRQKTIRKVCADLATHFDLQNVPGFSRQDNKWHLNLTDWHAGFLVPVRDKYGRIQACQIRRDTGQPRYIWLSSAGLSDGASSGAPVHFARPWRVASTGEAIITEGSLKSAVISEHLDACAIGIAGVSSFGDDFGQWLKSQLPQLEHVLIAFDSDWHKNPDVERAMLRLMATIEAAGLAGGLLDWSEAKGLDDLLTREVNA
ncbi:MAG TPA: DUF3854 domain-containing protein [Blastocatellia bacterium]|nr:DUF3854 domain-containing protein [Blastocatellia bacterium]